MPLPNIAYCSDKYQYTMGKSFYQTGRKDRIAVFNLFYRVAPEHNNWAVVSGTEEVIEMISRLRSEERRVGKECSEPCRSRWSPYH